MSIDKDFLFLGYYHPSPYNEMPDEHWEATGQMINFSNWVKAIPANEYIKTLIEILRDKHPHATYFELSFFKPGFFEEPEILEIFRDEDDIETLRFEYFDEEEPELGHKSLHFVFKSPIPNLSHTIFEAAEGKATEEVLSPQEKKYTFQDSPINYILTKNDTEITFHLHPNTLGEVPG